MRGEYSTKQKRELTEFLLNHDSEHFSIDDLVFQMEAKGDKIGRSTVYRCLEALAEQGSVRRYQNAQGVTQYQPVRNPENCATHFHMMCKKCGRLYHVDCDLMAQLDAHIRSHHAFTIDMRETVLVGVCGRCASEEVQHGADCGK